MTSSLLLAYLTIGVFAGTLSGLFGIGGGVIVVPALATIFLHFTDIPPYLAMKMAIGTSLAIMIVTLLTSLYAHQKRGTIIWPWVKRILPGLIAGVFFGAILVIYLPYTFLKGLFGTFLLVISLQLLLKKKSPIGQAMGFRNLSAFMLRLFSFLIGTLSSLLGAGGGTMWVPFFLFCRFSMHQAVGTSVACGMVAASIATLSFFVTGFYTAQSLPWSTSYVYWPAFLGVAAMSILFAPFGARLNQRMSNQLLRQIFAVVLFLMACDMLFF